MNYQNLLKIALRAIAANKMRSFLTALGIIIGIAAVITMLAIGEHQGEHRRDGFQYDHDFAGCRHERRCKTGCLIDGDPEAD